MDKSTFYHNNKLPTAITNTTNTKRHMLDNCCTAEDAARTRQKHNKTLGILGSNCKLSNDIPRSTTNHNCFCQQRSIAYFLAHSKRSLTLAVHISLILVCLAAITPCTLARSRSHARSAQRSAAAVAPAAVASPVAESLLGNAAYSSLSLNNTASALLMAAHEKNSLELSAAVAAKPVPAVENRRALKLAFLNNATVVCNDGSRAGFYLRKNPNSKKWIVFLEGGWHCYDRRSCRARWLRLRHLMTSAQWPDTRDVGGILSPVPEENPYWHNANHVLIPYCSSDSWSGTRSTIDENAEWRFMGAIIIRQVIAELIPLGLGRVSGAELLLVGSSAGGLGVMLNLDRITRYLQNERNLFVTVRGISDSGWFLDRQPYTPAAVGSVESVRQGWKLWQGSLPEACIKQYQAEPWRCYFGYRLYPTLKAPLFVFQWLFDEAQMRADNVGAPVTPQQWNYIHEMGGALRSSLDNVTGVFAPSCIGHAVLSKRDWINVKIDDISLPAALRCWEHSTRPRRRRHNDKQQHHEAEHEHRRRHRLNYQKSPKQRRPMENKKKENKKSNNLEPQSVGVKQRLSKGEREDRRRIRHERQQRRRLHRQHQHKANSNKHQNQHERKRNDSEKRNNNLPPSEISEAPQHKVRRPNKHNGNASAGERKHKPSNQKTRKVRKEHGRQQQRNAPYFHNKDNQLQQAETLNSSAQSELPKQHFNAPNARNRVPRVPEKCALRLLERCSWPQCNHSCPMVTNPQTGEEMRFLELLTSFGLDIKAVASALGLDMQTLSNMDRTELVNLLTQQAS
ncbi:palmitoleoyl-protein carboxylesterase NOTUM [Eurosta solidaginis]|uniref:palmitoleoyl-protein carboxylesterase NOTUM n=1 Tax=Eurosta solidaginis TaxID=178769 RepID=UPI0035309A21